MKCCDSCAIDIICKHPCEKFLEEADELSHVPKDISTNCCIRFFHDKIKISLKLEAANYYSFKCRSKKDIP